jgi:hypothetical protein
MVKNYNRIFTFGCSFTEWWCPTWADIIATDLAIPSQNWGVSGTGNVAIQHRMVECDLKNTFTDDDLILVLWSSWSREDRFRGSQWIAGGSIFNNDFYDESFVDKYWTEENDTVKNATAIIAANKMFNIQYQAHWTDYKITLDDYERLTPTPSSKLQYLIDALPKKNMIDYSQTEWNKLIKDSHPSVLQQLAYAEQFSNGIGTKLKTSTIKLYTDAHNHVTSILQDCTDEYTFDEVHCYFEKYISERVQLIAKEL